MASLDGMTGTALTLRFTQSIIETCWYTTSVAQQTTVVVEPAAVFQDRTL